MSSFILHTMGARAGTAENEYNDIPEVEVVYCTPSNIVRWQLKPAKADSMGIPTWAVSIVVDPAGFALPVLETPDQIAALHAYASERMWYGFNTENERIYMTRYDADVNGGVRTSPGEEERRVEGIEHTKVG